MKLALTSLLLPLLCFFSNCKGQSLKGHYMPFGLVYDFETVKDNSLSPVSYSGSLGGLSLGYYFQNEKWISLLDINGGGGVQKPDVNRQENQSKTLTAVARASYQLLRQVKVHKGYHFYAGVVSHNIYDFRSHNRYSNSSDNYTALFAFGASVAIQKPFTLLGENFAAQYNFGFPFGTYYMRPSYIKPYLNDKVGSKGFAFWGDYYLLSSKTELIWFFDNGNQFCIFYNWEFTQLDVLNKVQTDLQQIGISTIFKF